MADHGKDKFYEITGLDLRADACTAETQSIPIPTKVSCEIAVDGTVYKSSAYTHSAVCHVDFEDVATPPKLAPAESAGGYPVVRGHLLTANDSNGQRSPNRSWHK